MMHLPGGTMQQADIGLIGLAVMGQNLVLNMNDHGYTVAVYNRTASKTDEFLGGAAAARPTIIPGRSLAEFVGLLRKPRRVMLMVKAGKAVDDTIGDVLAFLEPGDIIIDGGNSHFDDSRRRTEELREKGILFIGTGVSGGEEGARNGPSIMPGGNPDAWPFVKELFRAISAKTPSGEPCCDWVGPGGAGHYVKMVHNGIEYGDMQLISEAYLVMRDMLNLDAGRMHAIFAEWNRGDLNSYLIQITGEILAFRDSDGAPLVDKILDTAGQKGTGKWTSINSLDLGIPVTLIAEAVYARALSAMKDQRVTASRLLKACATPFPGDLESLIEPVRCALLASKIISYAQGFMLLREASDEYGWDLNYGSIALMWRNGCIIRSVFLERIKQAFDRDSALGSLLLDDYFRGIMEHCLDGWRSAVAAAVRAGCPVPAFATALSFYDGYRSERTGANLLQAQRDYFGAHTYERIDRPRGQFFHTNWTGKGGGVSAGTYTV
jgi:6-phosphogluconate dehydrogenase